MHPLYTDPALQYLDSIIQKDWKVFEYGGGNSTQYYSEHCSEVTTVEHDRNWYQKIVDSAPSATVFFKDDDESLEVGAAELDAAFDAMNFNLPVRDDWPLSSNRYHGLINSQHRGYASTIWTKPPGYFDVVVVDGMARSLCLWYAKHMVNQAGIIILDNSCRWNFNDLQCYLIANGFNRKDFWQPEHPCWCTSIFSKSFETSDVDCSRPENTGDIYHV